MEEIVDSCKAKNLQIDEILLFYYMLGRQMAAEYENHPQNRVAFGMLPANPVSQLAWSVWEKWR